MFWIFWRITKYFENFCENSFTGLINSLHDNPCKYKYNIMWIIWVMIDCRCWYSCSTEFCVKKQVSQNRIMLETSGEFLILSYILMIENILSLRNIMLTETFWHKHLHTLVVGQLNELVYNILHILLNNIHPPSVHYKQTSIE